MGDYLFAKAFRIMNETGSLELIKAISAATERVSVGELRQIEETSNYSLSEAEYIEIIADKTASLFAVSCETGPILTSRDDRERRRFASFGESIGTAFQIADDLLDFVGDPDITGKEAGNDVMTGKVTLPLIYSLKQVSPQSSAEIIKKLRRANGNEDTFQFVYEFVHETGGIDYAYRRADELCNRGLESIGRLGDSVYYDSLESMVRYTTGRAS
jgi:octaprenyl-diphosphate synthase